MKTLILKELREQFKVALIACAVLTLMLVLAFQSSNEQVQRAAYGLTGTGGPQPLLSSGLRLQVGLLCALFGAVMGWLQIRAESHPDLWAFLVHRPISRSRILMSKVAAGWVLYGAAVGLPILGFTVLVSIPGKVAAPFEWAMALPLTAIVLSGVVYYLAGMLTGLRKARWFASRGFGLGMGLLVSGCLFVPEFWQAACVIAAASAVLLLAVLGSFQTGGYYRTQPVSAKLALVLTCTISSLIVIGAAFAILIRLLLGDEGFNYSQYQVLRDGRVVKFSHNVIDGGLEENTVVDLNGKPFIDEHTGRILKPKELTTPVARVLTFNVGFAYTRREHYADPVRFFAPWRVVDKLIWYLTADGRAVAYHMITHRQVATLAPPNSGAGSASEARFLQPQGYLWRREAQEYEQTEVLASPRTIYSVDFPKRELTPLYTATNGDVIVGCISDSLPSAIASPSQRHLLIVTRASILVMDFAGKTLLKAPYQPAFPEYSTVSVCWLEPEGSFAVRYDPDYFLNKQRKGTLPTHIQWWNADGSLRTAMDLPILPELRRIKPMDSLLVPLVPPGFPVYSWDHVEPIWQMLRFGPALCCVGVGLWMGRRNGFSRKAQVAWAVFHLLLGLPGLMAFLAVQEWTARETCSDCKKRRAVDRERCEHCGAAFPVPAKTGTEIFETLEAVS